MKKLKVFLLALLATTLSVGLIGCRKKDEDKPNEKPNEPEQPTDTKVIDRMNFSDDTSVIVITDADTQESFLTKVKSDLKITVRYAGAAVEKYDASDCDYDTSAVKFGEVGNYSVKVTPKSHNSGNISRDLDVTVSHNFVDNVCTKDGATRTTETIDVGLTYKLFHTGDAEYTAADDVSKQAIRPFGSIMVGDREERVKTYTVGRLEKGMSITVKGTAETTYDELGIENLYYFFPILGFADTSIGSYTDGAGTSVIVRNEGWVLLDGIGTPRLLAGKAAGGGGANDSGNYGSHPDDTGEKPAGYEDHGTGTPSLEEWKDWFTYSTGVTSSSDAYLDAQDVEFTWTYLNNGIIELIFKNNTSDIILTARTKVPDSSKGYYDTILHGEYVRMHFDEITTISTTTLTGVSFEGVSGRKVWLDNEMLDLSAFNVKITTEQHPEPAADTQFDIEANIGTAEEPKWVSLSTTPLDGATMKAFRVSRTMGNVTKTADIPLESFITIKTNAVDRAVPYTVLYKGVAFANNASIGNFELSTAVDGTDAVAKLVITGRANSLSAEQKAVLDGVTAAKYIAIRLWAREGATANFKSAVPAVKSGSAALAGAKAIVAEDGAYLDLILPVDATVRTNGVSVSGLVEGGVDVSIDLSGLESVSVTSQVSKGTLALNKGGDVTVVYTMSAEEYANMSDRSRIYVNGSSARFNALNDTKEEGYDYTGMVGTTKVSVKKDDAAHTVTVKYTLPKFSVENIEKFDLVLQDASNNTLAQDTVYYDLEFDANDPAVAGGFYTEATGTTLKVVVAGTMNDILSEQLSFNGLYLNLNSGSLDSLIFKNIGFAIKNGKYVFFDSDMEEVVTPKLTLFGTLDNSDDVDYGVIVVFELDLSKLGVTEVPYYFDLSIGSKTAPQKIQQVTDAGVTAVDVSASLGERVLVWEGSCLEAGYAAYPYVKDGNTVFYAGMTQIGGEHEFHDGVCSKCGATQTSFALPAWANVKADTIQKGEVLTLEGSYLEYLSGASSGDFYVGVTLQITTKNDGTFLWIRSDRYAEIIPAGNWNDRREITAEEGSAIDYEDTVFPTNADWLRYRTIEGARIVVTITLDNGVLTVIERNYSPLAEDASGLFYSVKYEFPNMTADSYKINFTRDNIAMRGDVTLTKAKLAPNSVSEITSSEVTVDGVKFDASAISYELKGTSGKYVVAAATGVAGKLTGAQAEKLGVSLTDYKYYATVKVSLDNALDAELWKGRLGEGKGKVLIDGNNVYAVIALNGEDGEAIVDLWNFEGIMTESDVKIDLSNIACSDVTAVLNADGLSVLGGTATISYTGAPEGASIEIGGKSFTVAELSSEKDFENGIKAIYGGNTLTLTVAKPDYTAAIPAYAVNLRDGDGKLLAQNTLKLNTLPATGTNVEGTHVIAEGAKLTLIVTDGVAASEGKVTKALYLNANTGKTTKLENLMLFDLSFAVETNGEVAFTSQNALVNSATVVYSPVGVVAITVDLGAVEIAENTVYGFEIRYESGAALHAYTVDANRAITPISGISATDETTELKAHSCDTVGIAASKTPASGDAAFYYNISVTASHTWGEPDAKGLFSCSVCGATLKSENAKNTNVAATALEGVATNGLTISFWGHGDSNNDWATRSVLTNVGNLSIMMPNLGGSQKAKADTLPDSLKNNATFMAAYNAVSENCWPDGHSTKHNGGTWNCLDDNFCYVSIVIDPNAGVNFYKNGVLVIEYKNETKGNGEFTVGQFVTAFLGCAEAGGIKFATAHVTAEDMVLQKTALNAEKAAARYANYLAEKSVLPHATPAEHVHVYDSATDRCPDDGALNPAHVHAYVKGACKCGTLCAHTTIADGACTVCGGTVQSSKTLTVAAGWDVTNKLAATFSESGQSVILSGVYDKAGGAEWSGMAMTITSTAEDVESPLYFLQAARFGYGQCQDGYVLTNAAAAIEWQATDKITCTEAGAPLTNKLNHNFCYTLTYTVTEGVGTLKIEHILVNATGEKVYGTSWTITGLTGTVKVYAADDGDIMKGDAVTVIEGTVAYAE